MSEWPDQGTVGEGRGRWGARVVLVLAGAVLVLLFWPQVNLEVTDKTGNESLPLWGPTKLARIARFLLLAGVTAALAWGMDWRVWRARWGRVEVLLGLVALGTALAVLPGPVDGANLFLAAEFVVCVAAVMAAHRALGAWMEREAMAEVVHRVLLVMFALLVVIFVIAFLVEPEMVYRDKLRGWRLGGSILGANTLAMVGLVVSVSAYALVLPGRAWGWRVLGGVMLVAGPTCLVLTRTRSLLLVFLVAAVMVDLARRADRARWRWAPLALAGAMGFVVVSSPLLQTDRLLRSLADGVAMVDGMGWVSGGERDGDAFTTTAGAPSAGESAAEPTPAASAGFGTIRDRITVYRYCMDQLDTYWLFGAGYVEGAERVLAGVFAKNPKVPWEPPHPHNVFFDVLLTRGVVLGAPLIVALALVCWEAARRVLRPRAGEPALNLMAVQVMALLGGSLGNFSLAGQVRPLLSALWLCAIVLLVDGARARGRVDEG